MRAEVKGTAQKEKRIAQREKCIAHTDEKGECRMKILMLGPDRGVHGGISGVVNNYYEAGLDRKIELRYIGTMVEGSRARKLWQAIKAYLQFLFALPKYDIVHVNVASDSSYYRKSVFIKTAHFFRKKIVIHQHGGDFEKFYYQDLGEKGRRGVQRVFRMADAFLVLAPVWKTFFGKIIGEEKITVLPNSISISAKKQKRYGQHKMLFLGRLCREKGIRELFFCIPALCEKYPDLKLYLGGIWEDESLKKEAQRYPEQIEWLGWITGEQKQKYLEECDIFVLPTYFEGQPVSVLEAMAASCAVVVSETGGIPMMIDGEVNGIFVKPQNRESLLGALDRALSDAGLCERLGKRAREKVEKDFSLEESMKRLLQIYAAVCGDGTVG